MGLNINDCENAYKALELEFGAGKTAINTAYHTLSLQYHPDKSKGDDTTEKFLKISDAKWFLIEEECWNPTPKSHNSVPSHNTDNQRYVELIKSLFQECYKLRPRLEPSIEPMILRFLGDYPIQEKVKEVVSSFFDDPSAYDTGACSKLFMDAIGRFEHPSHIEL